MRLFAALAISSLLAAPASAQHGAWRPAPVANATEPAEVIANSPADAWRPIEPENLLVMDLADGANGPGGRVIIELAPAFAPVHIANMRRFARAGWWNNATIYRVQDNYVAQWGNGDAEVPLPDGVVRRPPAEYERRARRPLRPRRSAFPTAMRRWPAMSDGWPVAWDPRPAQRLADPLLRQRRRRPRPRPRYRHRRRALRGDRPRAAPRSTATSPMSAGSSRGSALLSARPRGTGNLGFYQADRGETPIPIRSVRIAADMPEAERPRFEVMRTDTRRLLRLSSPAAPIAAAPSSPCPPAASTCATSTCRSGGGRANLRHSSASWNLLPWNSGEEKEGFQLSLE